jgi:hypothetical protein
LCEAGEHFQKNFLCEILLGDAPGQMGPHNPNDQRVKVFDQFARSRLVSPAHSIEAAGQIERQIVVRHIGMEARSDTAGKTRVVLSGYRMAKAISPLKTRPAAAARRPVF